jgi:hypothetical protein
MSYHILGTSHTRHNISLIHIKVLYLLNKTHNIMTVGETMSKLIKADNYAEERVQVSDAFIEMAKAMLGDYEYIREKEEAYQELIRGLKS